MVEHNIQVHVTKDASNKFVCLDCGYKCVKRSNLLNHFRKEHKNQEISKENAHEIGSTSGYSNDDYRKLKNNFERLNELYQESLEETDKMKAEYSAKLHEATEKYRLRMKS